MEKKRIKLEVAYDGTNYHGWQVQNNALAIEAVLSGALQNLLGEPVRLIGASRTDAGVHALGNVAIFDTTARIPPEKICYAVNQWLPADIRVMHSEEVSQEFHPRYLVSRKQYEYTIENAPIPCPLNSRYAYFVHDALDVGQMRKAAGYIIGEHDFRSFCSAGSQVKTTVRTIYNIEVYKVGRILTICVEGNGFLYNMVRIIAGTLIDVGKGYIRPEQIPEILGSGNRKNAGPTAPAHGLKLVKINYEETIDRL